MTTTLLLSVALVPKLCTTMSVTSTTLRIGSRTPFTRRRRHLIVRELWWYAPNLRWCNVSAMQSLQRGFHSLATLVTVNSVSYQGSKSTRMIFFSAAPDEDASAGAQSSPWVFPFLPVVGASEESNLQCQKIILQCQLVCPLTSSKHEKRQMVRRLVLIWHPDKAVFMQRDSKVCHEVCLFLNELRERSSLL